MTDLSLRPASPGDLDACIALLEAVRLRLRTYQPRFWNPAPGSSAMSRAWFGHLLSQAEVVFLVAEQAGGLAGFLIAQPQPAPPVYDPDGPTALVDDFWVDAPERWVDAGAALLAEARARMRERGVAQVVVVCPDREPEKKAMLAAAGLSIASTWWTAEA